MAKLQMYLKHSSTFSENIVDAEIRNVKLTGGNLFVWSKEFIPNLDRYFVEMPLESEKHYIVPLAACQDIYFGDKEEDEEEEIIPVAKTITVITVEDGVNSLLEKGFIDIRLYNKIMKIFISEDNPKNDIVQFFSDMSKDRWKEYKGISEQSISLLEGAYKSLGLKLA